MKRKAKGKAKEGEKVGKEGKVGKKGKRGWGRKGTNYLKVMT